jgi:hypothetical protein
VKLPIVGQAYTSRSKSLNAQRCVNLYPVLDSQGGKNVGALYGTPGLDLLATLPKSPIRGALTGKDGYLYVVAYDTFYQVDLNGNYLSKGTVSAKTSLVAMYENQTQIMIIAEDKGYIWNGSTLTQITDVDFTAGGELTLLNGYFIFNVPATDVFYISGQNDGSSVDPLEFSSANVDSDNIISLANVNQELWLFGNVTTEVWAYDANIDFPFARIDGATMEVGCAAKKSVIKADNSVFWLSNDTEGRGQIIRANGYVPQIISTEAIDYAISQYSRIDDAVAYAYQQEGHTFYVITFPSGSATWAYDAATGMWHERAYTDLNGSLERHRGQLGQFFQGMNVVSDHTNGNLYKLDLDKFTDNGDNITRLRSTPHNNQEANRIMWNQLQIDMEVGVGLESNEDPMIQMRWSDDGANTWSNAHLRSMGKIGEYLKRVIWRRLGTSRDRIFEIRTTEPVKIAIIDAYAKVTPTNG